MKECILFGGTFDPIHNGHMAIAAKLHEVFNHQVTFLPTGIPPYKPPSQALPIERLTMLQLAIGHTDKFNQILDIFLIEAEKNGLYDPKIPPIVDYCQYSDE